MAKWMLARAGIPGPIDYPALGFTARPGDVYSGDSAPDVFWHPCDEGAPETVDRYMVPGGDDAAIAALVNDAASASRAALSATYVAQAPAATTNQRLVRHEGATFDNSFTFEALSATQDGYFVVDNLSISAGAATPTYFKAVGFDIQHSGAGNLDVFWASVAHSGAREAGLFIGDLTGSAGGNLYGAHFLVTPTTVAPAVIEGMMAELAPSVARGSNEWYGVHARNSGTQQASAGVHVDGVNGGTFLYGVNVDKTAGAGAAGAALRLSGGSNWSNMIQGFAADGSTQIFRITSSGRADFTTGGVTSKYTSGATQPAYLTNGQIEVWQDTGTGLSYLVVNVDGLSKKVAVA